VIVGETILVTVNLNNVPPEGYTSAEFTCTYNPSLVETGNIAIQGLFGTDPAVATFDPQNGSFIVAIAGSNGQKAIIDGAVFTFEVTGLQAGQTEIKCAARVSIGNNALTDILSVPINLTVLDTTSAPAPAPAPTSSSSSSSPPSSPSSSPLLTGQVLASKGVTISLYNPDTSLAASTSTNTDGTFSLSTNAGAYTVVARASGFLSAQGPAVLASGGTSTKPTVSLIPGDIDGNNLIDQYDAISIGMSYNSASPDAADLNADGIINVLDLELLADHYRSSGALNWQ
jgi:hypothetical protein